MESLRNLKIYDYSLFKKIELSILYPEYLAGTS